MVEKKPIHSFLKDSKDGVVPTFHLSVYNIFVLNPSDGVTSNLTSDLDVYRLNGECGMRPLLSPSSYERPSPVWARDTIRVYKDAENPTL